MKYVVTILDKVEFFIEMDDLCKGEIKRRTKERGGSAKFSIIHIYYTERERLCSTNCISAEKCHLA